MKTAKINTSMAEYIGNELQVDGEFAIPDGWDLPEEIQLRSVWAKRRGVVLGRSWYLQVSGRTPAKTIDLVSFAGDYGHAQFSSAKAFLELHGYRCTDEVRGDYSR